jgi:hypothetical protein
MGRVGHEVIQEILQLNERHVVVFTLRTMRLGLRMEFKIRQICDEGDALRDIRYLMSGTSQKVVQLLGVDDVSPITLRK